MVFDGFTFFNELELLELRLETMYDSVDRFIIVESRKTFTNQDKRLYFDENKEKFNKYMDKIEYVVIDEFPVSCTSAWDREHYQRDAIYRGVKKTSPDDILIISDLDEIISPYGIGRIKKLLKKNPEKILKLELLNTWYFLNYVDQKQFFWTAPVAYNIDEAEKSHSGCRGSYELDSLGRITPQTARSWNHCTIVPCAGWHFSYMGDLNELRKKFKHFLTRNITQRNGLIMRELLK